VIETIRDGKNISSFNQFTAVGNSNVGQAINYIDNMIQNTYNFMGETMGIPPQRKGQVTSADQVGTFEKSIEQSLLITEILHEDHDEVQAKAYSILMNLYSHYCMGKDTNLTIGDNDIRMIKVEGKVFEDTDFDVMVEDDGKAETKMKEIKNIMKQGYDSRQIGLSQFMQVYLSDSVKEVEKLVLYFAEEGERVAQQAQAADEEGKSRLAKEQEELKFQYESKLKEMEANLKEKEQQYNAQLESAKLQVQKEINDSNNQVELNKLSVQAEDNKMTQNLKLMELLDEQSIETQLLQENKEARTISNKLDALKLKMESIINGVSLDLQRKGKVMEHKEKMRKIDVDIDKAHKITKEKVSDR